jgi:hypothetical protein
MELDSDVDWEKRKIYILWEKQELNLELIERVSHT